MLADPNRALDGFTLPDGRSTTNQMYADDSALYLQENETNLDRAMEILTI